MAGCTREAGIFKCPYIGAVRLYFRNQERDIFSLMPNFINIKYRRKIFPEIMLVRKQYGYGFISFASPARYFLVSTRTQTVPCTKFVKPIKSENIKGRETLVSILKKERYFAK
jgi:hypothetical protein